VYQFPIDEPDENYSMYGSYEFPIFSPRLRLKLYGGYSDFDIDPEGASGFNFFGNGWFYGGLLRYNVHQQDGWFFDVTSSLSQEKSKITSSMFNSVLGSEVRMNLWGALKFTNQMICRILLFHLIEYIVWVVQAIRPSIKLAQVRIRLSTFIQSRRPTSDTLIRTRLVG